MWLLNYNYLYHEKIIVDEEINMGEYYGLMVLIGIIMFFIHIGVAIAFADLMQDKGYEKSMWGILAFFFGLPIWLVIIAKPNKKFEQNVISEINSLKLMIVQQNQENQSNNLPEI